MIRAGRTYAPGEAAGQVLVLVEPLSFWGGIDVTTGKVIDRAHPDLGKNIAGQILVMPGGRGSSSSSSILAEAIRLKTAPLGIILAFPDPILTVGALVAWTLYGLRCPIVVCPVDGIKSGDQVRLRAEPAAAEIEIGP